MSMEIANSNKRYSIIIAGILVIMTVAIFIAFTMGVLGNKIYSVNGVQPIGKILDNSGRTISENNLNILKGSDKLVLGSKRGCDIPDMKTEPGTIDVSWVLNDPTYQLPLCIDEQADIDPFDVALDIFLEICGGYKPSTDSYVYLDQFWCGTLYDGMIGITWTPLPKQQEDCCCITRWEGHFVYVEDLCFVSTELPTVTPICMSDPDDDHCPDPWEVDHKLVDVELNLKFEGCHFWTIPASDFQFLGSLTPSEFKNSSPVKCDNYVINF
jgi:hypothetical protein